jgi:hypothetical protein
MALYWLLTGLNIYLIVICDVKDNVSGLKSIIAALLINGQVFWISLCTFMNPLFIALRILYWPIVPDGSMDDGSSLNSASAAQ